MLSIRSMNRFFYVSNFTILQFLSDLNIKKDPTKIIFQTLEKLKEKIETL